MKIETYLLGDNTSEFIIKGTGKPLQVLLSDVLGGQPLAMLYWLSEEGDSRHVLQVMGHKPGELVYGDIEYTRDYVSNWQYLNTTEDITSWFWKVG
jgi:hypothetical protein